MARSHKSGLELATIPIVTARDLRYMRYENLQYEEKRECKHLIQWDAMDKFHALAAKFLPL